MSSAPFSFIPSSRFQASSGAGLWFAFRGRELLVSDSFAIPNLPSLEVLGLATTRVQYLGALDFPPNIFSVLAGFVDPGESVEEAVYREVFEETGIKVSNVRYFSSQPWPFPNSLMLGYQAEHAGGELRLDPEEIEDAAFFHVDALPPMFPGSVSISQWLIQDFCTRHGRSLGGEPR